MDAIRPQPGPQTAFLTSNADIAIYGGAAGGGKTWSLLLDPLRHVENPGFTSVIFRRTYPEITSPGGLWPESTSIYPWVGGTGASLAWRFPSGAKIKFSHMQREADMFKWLGSQICNLSFDQLETFTEDQFFFMLSRNRSVCGVRPYARATANPEPGWLADFLAWWIDQDSGYPIPERDGVLRWFVRKGNRLVWGNSPDRFAASEMPLSVTFIHAKLDDNPALIERDPDYRGKLMAQSEVLQERLLRGNWKAVREGAFFKTGRMRIIKRPPIKGRKVRFWDFASTEGDGDYTCGVLMLLADDGLWYILDIVRGQWDPSERDEIIRQTAALDGPHVAIVGEEEGGSSGKSFAAAFIRMLAGYTVQTERASGSKATRADALASQLNAGNVLLVEGPWNKDFIDELREFRPDESHRHDDQVDAAAGAFNKLTGTPTAGKIITAPKQHKTAAHRAPPGVF